jgi:hypothetical protein
LPGTDDPDCNDAVSGKVQLSLPIADEAFEAMLQDFDQDAMEAEPVPLELPPPEEGLLEHDGREGGEEERLGELWEKKPQPDETSKQRLPVSGIFSPICPRTLIVSRANKLR